MKENDFWVAAPFKVRKRISQAKACGYIAF